MPSATPPLSGRRAQAARNDQLILDAARAVFHADPGAPISSVAEHAGVGISALYRRYRSKDELLQQLATDALQRYLAAAEAALADSGGDPWTVFANFMRRAVLAGTSSLTLRFAGTFSVPDDLQRLGGLAFQATQELLDRTHLAGVIRSDIDVGDLALLFEQLQAIQLADPQRTRELHQRYLALVLDGLRPTAATTALPGPPPTWEEIRRRYDA